MRRFEATIGNKRRCERCKLWKPLEAFARDPTRSRGRQYRCATCKAAATREHRAKFGRPVQGPSYEDSHPIPLKEAIDRARKVLGMQTWEEAHAK